MTLEQSWLFLFEDVLPFQRCCFKLPQTVVPPADICPSSPSAIVFRGSVWPRQSNLSLCFSYGLLKYAVSLMYFSLRVILEQDLCFLYTAASEPLSSTIEITSNVLSVRGTCIRMWENNILLSGKSCLWASNTWMFSFNMQHLQIENYNVWQLSYTCFPPHVLLVVGGSSRLTLPSTLQSLVF